VGQRSLEGALPGASIRGEKIGAFALTEANAGSDTAAITTRVRTVDGGYVISGTKMFTSSSPIADFIIVAATTDPAKGARGIGLFLVDVESPGFSVGRKIEKFLIHGSDTAETIYDDVFVPEECRLGEESGFLNAHESLTVDRIFTAALALGNACRTRQHSLRGNAQFGRPIGKFQAVQFKLVDMLALLEQARLYVYEPPSSRPGPLHHPRGRQAKMIARERHPVCQKALQVFGGYGLTRTSRWSATSATRLPRRRRRHE
jgi:alkylation response protein AidB-like acyl-CoA dehydrogenase